MGSKNDAGNGDQVALVNVEQSKAPANDVTGKADTFDGKAGFGELGQGVTPTGTAAAPGSTIGGASGFQKKKTQNEKYVEFRKT